MANICTQAIEDAGGIEMHTEVACIDLEPISIINRGMSIGVTAAADCRQMTRRMQLSTESHILYIAALGLRCYSKVAAIANSISDMNCGNTHNFYEVIGI
jgi:hypothetical protein